MLFMVESLFLMYNREVTRKIVSFREKKHSYALQLHINQVQSIQKKKKLYTKCKYKYEKFGKKKFKGKLKILMSNMNAKIGN